ncbi:EamA family transporter [Acidiphilium sp. AL]|uniref:aromatic amino acid exporter YddG n=1 Tax=Acidiphilium sp. AL TaxID=2871704 RepID=UPI0021CAEFFA|nr:EamA family transporter [Acidiphilium sp. AL]MCU4159197.1 EamA family transporter [Acidiphilium sp. AL]
MTIRSFNPVNSERSKATAIGGLAILLWSTLALLAASTRGIPPFETLVLSFGVAFAAGMVVLVVRRRLGRLRQPVRAWALGFAGIFTYHALYFTALDHAPAAQASLICYLWPLLIVVFAAFLPGGRLHARHVAGAALGLAGTVLILLSGTGLAGNGSALGYGCAFAAAFVWAGYSVANQRIRAVPSELIAGICGAVAFAALLVHLAVEQTVIPSTGQAVAMIALGVGPVGLAFFFWDHATKRGDLALLGTLSYAAPLLSTALLVAVGRTPLSVTIIGAAALIVGGAGISVGFRRPKVCLETRSGESVGDVSRAPERSALECVSAGAQRNAAEWPPE